MRLQNMTALRTITPETFMFEDDGQIPNNPDLPLLVYHAVVDLAAEPDPAKFFEDLFCAHHWGRMWRDGIYKYEHYHSKIHEVLGIAAGSADVRFGGTAKGRIMHVEAGDVVILPAGTGHECIRHSKDFLVVGAYRREGVYDEGRGSVEAHDHALKTIPQVPLPVTDPVYGARGPLQALWIKPKSRRSAA